MSLLRYAILAHFCCLTIDPSFSLADSYDAITTKRVQVRSGPSEDYYRTAILDADTPLRVIREEPNGWLAIEPPEDSFSWINGAFVRQISSTEGEVTGNNVLVRIGTPLDPRMRDYSQVKLNRGDKVQILGAETSGQASLTHVWYRIAPPRGEVRYVSAQCVKPLSTSRGTATRKSSAELPPPRDLGTEEPAPGGRKSPRPQEPDEEPELDDHSPAPPVQITKGSPLERANAAYQEMMRKILPDRDIARVRRLYEAAAQSARGDSEHDFIAARLELLQLQEARQEKFEEFDRAIRRLRQRDEALLSLPGAKEEDDDSGEPEPARRETPARYDASGILRRSTAVIEGKPAFVLVSPQGGIRYYATAGPGVDLKKHLDQLVAVRGSVSYRVEVRAQHITIRDVTVLEIEF